VEKSRTSGSFSEGIRKRVPLRLPIFPFFRLLNLQFHIRGFFTPGLKGFTHLDQGGDPAFHFWFGGP